MRHFERGGYFRLRPLLLCVYLSSAPIFSAGSASACDIALALAVDVSGSVDAAEYRLQMGGLADALRDATVSDALVRAEAAILLVQWSGLRRQDVSINWTRVTDRADLAALADRVDATPRVWRDYSTGIGEALAFTANTYAQVGDCRRKVIDVSGDGPSNEGIAPETIRAALVAEGFTINALAIEGAVNDLTGYYRDNVIGGPGAFVVTANSFSDYPRRILQKLLREVSKQIADTSP